jgi:hypothetical protein
LLTSEELVNWNLNEIIPVILITVQIHKLSIICETTVIQLKDIYNTSFNECRSENCISNNKIEKKNSAQSDSSLIELTGNTINKQQIIKELKELEVDDMNDILKPFSNCDSCILTSPKLSIKDKFDENFIQKHENSDYLPPDIGHDGIFNKYLHKHYNVYHDFDAHSEEYHSYLEYNWADHGLYTINDLYTNGVVFINSEIEYITNLTTNSLGEDSQLNTFPLRMAISIYIESILGYNHEDYNYANINKILQVNFKKFIKNVACYPKKITEADFTKMSSSFNKEEILHIILLVATVKSRTQLTYFTKALYEIIKNID